MTFARWFDVNGVLLKVYDEEFATKNKFLQGYHASAPASEHLLIQGIETGKLNIQWAPGARERLHKDRLENIAGYTFSTHPVPRQRAEFARMGLEHRLTYQSVYPKRKEDFLEGYSTLMRQGVEVISMADDSEDNAYEAMRASLILSGSDRRGITVYLVKSDARFAEIGETDYGFVIVKNVGQIDKKVSRKKSTYKSKNKKFGVLKKMKRKAKAK